MIDLHTHILPKMDDGSQSVAESQKLLALLQQQGVRTVAATPHFYANRETPEEFLRRRAKAAADLGDTPIPLILGAETAYFSGISSCRELTDLQLGNSGLLLVEMPFCPWTERIIKDVCDIPARLGLIPVLAHVDRYRSAEQFPKFCRRLLDNDVLFQCNAEVFETFTGRLWAFRQFRGGNLHFLGSDAHNLTSRPPKLDMAAKAIKKKLGMDALAWLDHHAQQWLQPDL